MPAFIVMLDTGHGRDELRARLGDALLGVDAVSDKRATIIARGKTISMRKVGNSAGENIYVAVGRADAVEYMRSKLGAARVLDWPSMLRDTTTIPQLGNRTMREWLLSLRNGPHRMFKTYAALPVDDPVLDGAPIPNLVIAGEHPLESVR